MEEIIIYEVPIRTIKYLFYEWKKKRPVARSYFLSKNNYDVYIAVDNLCDGFAINEFDSYDKALFWLCSKNATPEEVNKIDRVVINTFNQNCNCKVCQRYWVKDGISF